MKKSSTKTVLVVIIVYCLRILGNTCSKWMVNGSEILIRVFFSVALEFLDNLGSHFFEVSKPCFRHVAGLLERGISPSQGLNLHRTAQRRKARTNNHAFSGIQTHDPRIQATKTHAPDRATTVISSEGSKGKSRMWQYQIDLKSQLHMKNKRWV
jgi:hypothetical protein